MQFSIIKFCGQPVAGHMWRRRRRRRKPRSVLTRPGAAAAHDDYDDYGAVVLFWNSPGRAALSSRPRKAGNRRWNARRSDDLLLRRRPTAQTMHSFSGQCRERMRPPLPIALRSLLLFIYLLDYVEPLSAFKRFGTGLSHTHTNKQNDFGRQLL